MRTTEFVSKHSRLKTSFLLSNLPIPSGDNCTSSEWDYDEKRFFQPYVKGVREFKRNTKQDDLIKQLAEYIKEISSTEEPDAASIDKETLTVHFLPSTFEIWMPKEKGLEPIEPIEFKLSYCEVTTEVLHFCSQHGILQYLRSTIDLIEKYFPSLQELHLEIENDPESDEEWLTIDITVKGEIEEIIENYNNYISKFVSIIPWPEREKIILSYNIL